MNSTLDHQVVQLETEYIVLLIIMLLMALFWIGVFVLWKFWYYPKRPHFVIPTTEEEDDKRAVV